jgi:hypothetical protein
MEADTPFLCTAEELFGWLKVSQAEADTMDPGKNECGASNYGKVGVSAEA